MPFFISRLRSSRLGAAAAAVGATLVLSAGASGPADAAGIAAPAWCSNPVLTQPFLAWGDQSYYTLVRGQGDSGFVGNGWTMTGGARVVTTQLSDGTTGGVLDLPSGANALSPIVCVNSSYPDARMLVNDVSGDEGVEVDVSYLNMDSWIPSWTQPVDLGAVNGGQSTWALSDPVDLPTPADDGWQLARFTFAAGGTSSEFQIYDFYLDPYSRG
jgi:hypothetical protein